VIASEIAARPNPIPPGFAALVSQLRRWAPCGFLALLDQGLISGSNFVLGLCLARSAGPASYGAYAIMFAVFLLIANVHQALLLEPTNVLGFSLFPQRSDRYLRSILMMHLIFSAAFLALSGAIWMLGPRLHIPGSLANALAGLIVASPCILLFWLARCFSYLDFAPARAVRGSTLYCAVALAALATGSWRGAITPLAVFACMGAAALAASFVLLIPYRGSRPALHAEPGLAVVWSRHWGFGRWGLSTVGLTWSQTNSISVICGGLLGLTAAGGLNALVGLLLPMFQVLSAATRVVLPRIARIYTLHGIDATKSPVLRVAAVLGALASAYWLALTIGHTFLLHWTYGQRFAPYAYLIPIISLHLIACSLITACDIAFNAIQSPQSSFQIKVLIVAIMLPVNALLTWRFGLVGAAVSVPALSAATGICMALKLRSVWRRNTAAVPGEGVVAHA